MRALNNKAKPSHYFGFVAWLTFIIGAFIYLVNRELSPFDPNRALSNISSQKLIESMKTPIDSNISFNKTIIHISDEACHCNGYTKNHQLAINKLAAQNDFSIQYLSIDELPDTAFIPSTPVVMLLGENNELIYFGPYAQGIACSENNTILELAWKNYLKGFNANIIFGEAEGCYCNR